MVFIASPIDDAHHNLFYGAFGDDDVHDGVHPPDFVRAIGGDRPYDPFDFGGFSGSREDNYGQDRDAMQRGHFSGFTGNILQEDMVTQASMGAIVDRTQEHLSSADVAVIHARRLLLQALDDMDAGRPVMGSGASLDHRDALPVDMILPAPPAEAVAPR